jgi:hypothetical protein
MDRRIPGKFLHRESRRREGKGASCKEFGLGQADKWAGRDLALREAGLGDNEGDIYLNRTYGFLLKIMGPVSDYVYGTGAVCKAEVSRTLPSGVQF